MQHFFLLTIFIQTDIHIQERSLYCDTLCGDSSFIWGQVRDKTNNLNLSCIEFFIPFPKPLGSVLTCFECVCAFLLKKCSDSIINPATHTGICIQHADAFYHAKCGHTHIIATLAVYNDNLIGTSPKSLNVSLSCITR